jgi:alpha-glucosidase
VHPFKEAIIPFTEKTGKKRKINIVVRAFDDGVAFRYEFPKQDGWNAYQLTEERTSFNLLHNPRVHTLFFANTTSSHEGFYSKLNYNNIPEDSLMDMPALFIFPDSIYMSITEASLKNYAGMYLQKKGGMLESSLSPLPGQQEIKVKATLPHKTPWRVLLISDRVGDLIESNIITSLNDPLAIDDISWIKPGQTTFHWWNGDIAPDTSFEPGLNFNFNKYYIDFCAANGIDYHAVIGYGGRPWYKNDGVANYQPGPNTDITQIVPGFSMKQVADYAKSKGVGIHTWVHWQALYPKIDTAFALFEQWGIKGMMVDFMDRDDQEMVNIQEEILRKAAKHKLYIQFHGAFKPTGLHRTYPNEFTREGTYNYEQDKWAQKSVNADHDLDMPFTRGLAGAADYHLGGFRAVPESTFKPQFTRPLVTSTRAHMLAMYIVLESYLTSICDYPDAYQGQEGFDLLTTIPTTWDETKVLDAKVGGYIITARRKGNDWYIGGINSSQARTLTIPMNFLGAGSFEALIYTDASDAADNPNHLYKEIKTIESSDRITIPFAGSGGVVIKLIKK